MSGQRQERTTVDHANLVDTRRTGLERLAWAGIIGPILFTVAYMVQEQFRRNEYDPIAEVVSALEAGPNGWVQQVNFVILGLLTMAFAVGLHRGIRPSRAGIVGPAMIFVSGFAALVSAAFPLREDEFGITYDPGGHMVGGSIFFATSSLSLVVLSLRLRQDPRWQGLASYVLTAGLAAVATFPFMSLLVVPDTAPLHDWAGLAQRVIVLAILFPCRIALSLRLLRIARADR